MFREALCITNIADFYRMQKGYIPPVSSWERSKDWQAFRAGTE
jgi:hypothetical protein